MGDLAGLIERLKALSGPDREVDGLIAYVTDFRTEDDGDDAVGTWRQKVDRLGWDHAFKYLHSSTNVWSRWIPAYTASLDAAVALVERKLPGWDNSSIREGKHHLGYVWKPALPFSKDYEGKHHVRAIALLLALLSALSSGDRE